MKILLITVQYYPSLNPNVYRWAAIAEYWVAQGHEVHVLCTRRSGLPAGEQINGVWVHRVGQATLLDAAYNLAGAGRRRGEAGTPSHQATAGERTWNRRMRHSFITLLRLALERLVDLTWRSVYWPDGSCLWYLPGRRRARALAKVQTFDAMISVCLPFTSNLIAWAVKRQHPSIRWLVDVEDPFAIQKEQPKNNPHLYRRFNFRMEKRVLDAADVVSFTVESARQRYVSYFGMANKYYVTPPMYNDRQAQQAAQAEVALEPGKIHLAYIGSFYHRIREPAPLLDLLDAVAERHPDLARRLTVHVIGHIEPRLQKEFSRRPHLLSMLQFHGLLPRADVFAWMRQVDFLINIGNTTDYQLPSKSVDYLAAGKPIINIYQQEADSVRAFLADYPLLLNVNGRTPASRRNEAGLFRSFVEAQAGKRAPESWLIDRLAPFRLASIADRYRGLLAASTTRSVERRQP